MTQSYHNMPFSTIQQLLNQFSSFFSYDDGESSVHSSFFWRTAVIDCFDNETNQLDCVGASVNSVVTLALVVLALIQLLMMISKRICCTWKFFLTLFVLVQTTFLFFQLLLLHEYHWTFILTFLEMSGFLFILWFFSQYYGRVNSHSDHVNPWIIPLFGVVIFCMVVLLVVEILKSCGVLNMIDLCLDVGLIFFTFLRCIMSIILLLLIVRISTHMRAMTNSGRMKRSLTSFTLTAITYLLSAIFYVFIQLFVGLSFSTESICMSYFDTHKVAYFFTTILSFFFGFAVPYAITLFYVHSITSPISTSRPQLSFSSHSINDSTSLLNAALLDPVSQMLMNAHQQSMDSSYEQASFFDPNAYYDDASSDSSSSSNSSSFSYLQPQPDEGNSTPTLAQNPFLRDNESETSDGHGFFDADSDSDSLFAGR